MDRQVMSSSGRYPLASVGNAGVFGQRSTSVLIRIGALAMSVDADEAQDFSNALRDAAAEARGVIVSREPGAPA